MRDRCRKSIKHPAGAGNSASEWCYDGKHHGQSLVPSWSYLSNSGSRPCNVRCNTDIGGIRRRDFMEGVSEEVRYKL